MTKVIKNAGTQYNQGMPTTYTGDHPQLKGQNGIARPNPDGKCWQFRPEGGREWYRVHYENLVFAEEQAA